MLLDAPPPFAPVGAQRRTAPLLGEYSAAPKRDAEPSIALLRRKGDVQLAATRAEQRISYERVKKAVRDQSPNLLLGNGFSIACDECFAYRSLYQRAVAQGLSENAQRLFDRLGTNNFEGAMRLLDDCIWVNELYGNCPPEDETLDGARESIKQALIDAISESHLTDQSAIRDGGVKAAKRFLSGFDRIFTTNYDLLSYWADMSGPRRHDDCFRQDPDNPESESVVFDGMRQPKRAVYFLHGAIHLYTDRGQTRKHSWVRSGKKLTDLVEEGLEEDRYPLFVAEGAAEKKLQQIGNNHYLAHCLDEFSNVEGPLVTCGFSFGDSDAHIVRAIERNLQVQHLYVAFFGDFDSAETTELRARVKRAQEARGEKSKPLHVRFFNSAEVEMWGAPSQDASRSVSGW